MDVVYVCSAEEENEELRYSLRSLVNFKHTTVWIFGGAPSWVNRDVVNVMEIAQEPYGFKDAWRVKYENVRRNITAACQTPWVSDDFVLMNDDFYFTAPVERVLPLHMGTEADFNAWFRLRQAVPSAYVWAERATLEWCRWMGVQEPLSYALHVPLPIEKAVMADLLENAPWDIHSHPLHMRSAYGNLAGIGGTKVPDVKVEQVTKTGVKRLNGVVISGSHRDHNPRPVPYCSTTARTFVQGDVGRWLRAMFPEPCPYELSGSQLFA